MELQCTENLNLQTAFNAAICAADAVAVEQLLIDGADSNVQDERGCTPLHLAVESGQARIAACLLAYGADHRICNRAGQMPLTTEYAGVEKLHRIRQEYHRFRKRDYACSSSLPLAVAALADDFERRGIIKLPGFINPKSLTRMQNDFKGFVQELDQKRAKGEGLKRHYDEELHWWALDRAYVSNNAFKYSAEFVKFACDETILAIANRYIGKPAHIQRGIAMRYLPTISTLREMFNWHHDMEERRVKAMILLTDVGRFDQYMSYIVGSNKIFHELKMFRENFCTPSYCRKQIGQTDVFKTLGHAGDVFLFDSNGAHRGNRAIWSKVRDAVFIEFSADKSQVWGGDIDESVFDTIDMKGGNPFDLMLKAEKKWNVPTTRKAPDWVEKLPQVESWL